MERLYQQSSLLPSSHLGHEIHLIGAGGIGSFTALGLLKMGFNNVTVWDFDTIEEHNVDNQLYGPGHLGILKTQKLKEICLDLTGISPYIQDTAWSSETRPNPLSNSAIIVFALDSILVRKTIFDNLVASLFAGTVIDGRMGAEVISVYNVNCALDIERYRATLYPDEEIVRAPCTAKSIMYTPFAAASFIGRTVKGAVQGEIQPFAKHMDLDKFTSLVET